jgi:hypothetical protein
MRWSATQARFVVLASLALLGWYVSTLMETNAGWGWGDPEFSATWSGRPLAIWTAVAAAAALIGAAIWRPSRWTILAPALVAALGLVIRQLYVIGSPPDFFLSDHASARWYLAGLCLLQLVVLGLTIIPAVGRRSERVGND